MQMIPPIVRTTAREALRKTAAGYRTYERILTSHPILLIPAIAIYAFASFLVAVVALFLGIGVALAVNHYSPIPGPEFGDEAFFFGKIFFVPLAVTIWLHYLYLAFRSVVSASTIKGYAGPIMRVVQLVATSVFIFAIAHYYVALFTDGEAYNRLKRPEREQGWQYAGLEDRLAFVPSIDTVLDCVYFSTITTATIGYGDIYPLTPAAKIVTIIQTMFSFGLIAVILGWVIGHATDKTPADTSGRGMPAESRVRRLPRQRPRKARPVLRRRSMR